VYDYRTLTPEQQAAVVAERQQRGFPWHGPPHPEDPDAYRLVSATCYEHRHILSTPERLQWFEQELLNTLQEQGTNCAAWCVLSNHYHVLVQIEDVRQFTRALGRLHGRTSFEMNRQDGQRGRQVWYRCQDRCMRSEAHFYTTLNYIHNNPVKYGYVSKWQAWPFSSFHWYLQTHGRDWLIYLWKHYPVLNYGEAWDTFALEHPPPAVLSDLLPPKGGTTNEAPGL
jgi:putative transposase